MLQGYKVPACWSLSLASLEEVSGHAGHPTWQGAVHNLQELKMASSWRPASNDVLQSCSQKAMDTEWVWEAGPSQVSPGDTGMTGEGEPEQTTQLTFADAYPHLRWAVTS